MLTPSLYRTRITHLRRAPVHHYFEQRGYSWLVDLDNLPQLPRGLRPFAKFEARDHFSTPPPAGVDDTLRNRVDAFLAERGIDVRDGTVTALLQARVLGYVFNPISIYWCHDSDGVLRHVIAEVHNTYGGRHAYLLPPTGDAPAAVKKSLYVSPFNEVDGYYLVRAPEPDESLDVAISLHREHVPAFVATLRGTRRRAGVAQVLRMQLIAPAAPLMGAVWIRIQGITLWARRVPVVPRTSVAEKERVKQL
ncbi:DUF1365 domain-containing protein [Mycolicibacterium sp. YH-1]|uniref:DUF1365 domain-containing protein n=1 Tax=Mycolicibacterium sp. YH-1 TaxID=2908837 RepID=UPI001F4BD021|nr:DUF1365 family protein [Mycolicibacterium sp. YH-1]UNB53828.1 DUF1365 family protein [Mycolicibacterium sp. YH-1]